jgi:hypothetical protein
LARLLEYFNDERLIQSGRNLILAPLAESLVESVSDLASSVISSDGGSSRVSGSPMASRSLGLRDNSAQNADGSTDLYLGPKTPAGKEANWLATMPGKGYFAILRLYGPTEAAFNKTWKTGDIEKLN